jgi:hypothetical protein
MGEFGWNLGLVVSPAAGVICCGTESARQKTASQEQILMQHSLGASVFRVE